MHITILQEHLCKTLGKTTRILSSKPQLPILSYALLSTTKGVTTITTTNIESTIRTIVPSKVKEEGSVCIPGKLFLELIQSLPNQTIDIMLDNESLIIQTTNAKAILPTLSAGEFPSLPDYSSSQGVTLESTVLLSGLHTVLPFVSSDESRPVLRGVLIENTEYGISFVSTDGYRLSLKRLSGVKNIMQQSTIIPSGSLIEIIRNIVEEKEEKTIQVSETVDGQLFFFIDDTHIMTRRIDGEYPNYKKIIPQSFITEARCDRKLFHQAVKSAAIFARDNVGIIKVSLEQSIIHVSASAPSLGENTISLDARVEGEGGVIAINSRFLLEALSVFSSEDIIIRINGVLNPVMFTAPDDDSFFHIIMPVRV